MNDKFYLVVKYHGGNEIHFQVSPTTTMRTLIESFCQRDSRNPDAVLLKVQGSERYLMPDETMNSAGLTSNDVVEVVS